MATTIFITGASGAVGHYILDQLLERTDVELYLLVRGGSSFLRDLSGYAFVHLVQGRLEHIEEHRDLLASMDYVIHIATSWRPSAEAALYNVDGTVNLFNCCDLKRCKRIIYFSTASILVSNDDLIDIAHTKGSWYINTKLRAYQKIQSLSIYDRVVTLFPTMVVCGDDTHPHSHILEGIQNGSVWLKYLRFFSLPGSFHFLHGVDIATVTLHLLFAPKSKANYVLGVPFLTLNQVIKTLSRFFGFRYFAWIRIPHAFLLFIASFFPKRVGPWERHCLRHLNMVYDVVEPKTFGLETKYPAFDSFLKILKKG